MLVVALIEYRDAILFKYECLDIKLLMVQYHMVFSVSMHRVYNGLPCGSPRRMRAVDEKLIITE